MDNNLRNNPLPLDKNIKSSDWWTLLEDIPVHGDELGAKEDANIRIYFENIDGFCVNPRSPAHNNNHKLKYFNTLISQLEVDIYGGAETRTNWSMLPATHRIDRLLQLRDGGSAIAAHNKHEKFSIAQQGGTFLATMAPVVDIISDRGADPTGLGRWCWITLSGTTTTTRIIVAYAACSSRKQAHSATIAQQRRYWKSNGNDRCPRRLFREQLINHLKMWRENGEKLVLLIDSNENMERGKLERILRQADLQMYDIVKNAVDVRGQIRLLEGASKLTEHGLRQT